MKTKTVLITGILVAAAVSASAFAGKDDKIELCHVTGNGTGHVINASGAGLVAHLAHGDSQVFVTSPDGSCVVDDVIPR